MVPIDANSPCGSSSDPALYDFRVRGADGKMYCRVPVVRETLPNGRSYETVELGRSPEDNFGPVTVPAGHVWLMGDNRDDSRRQPRARDGRAGSAARCRGRISAAAPSSSPSRSTASTRLVEPADLVRGAALRPRRKVAPEQLMAQPPPTTEPHIERPGPAEFRDPLVRREMRQGRGLARHGACSSSASSSSPSRCC